MKNNGRFIKRAMVVGGGIAGISASIDIGNAGYDVILVEKLPSIRRKDASALRDLSHA